MAGTENERQEPALPTWIQIPVVLLGLGGIVYFGVSNIQNDEFPLSFLALACACPWWLTAYCWEHLRESLDTYRAGDEREVALLNLFAYGFGFVFAGSTFLGGVGVLLLLTFLR